MEEQEDIMTAIGAGHYICNIAFGNICIMFFLEKAKNRAQDVLDFQNHKRYQSIKGRYSKISPVMFRFKTYFDAVSPE